MKTLKNRKFERYILTQPNMCTCKGQKTGHEYLRIKTQPEREAGEWVYQLFILRELYIRYVPTGWLKFHAAAEGGGGGL